MGLAETTTQTVTFLGEDSDTVVLFLHWLFHGPHWPLSCPSENGRKAH